MRRKLLLIVIVIVCFLLQCTIFKELTIANISPNLLIVLTASVGFMRGQKEGLLTGFFCGVLMDLMFGNILGLYALLYMYVGFVNGYFKRIFYPESVKLPIFLIACSDFFCNVVIYIAMFLFRKRFAFGYYFTHVILAELVYTMVIAIVLYFILLKINNWLEKVEQRSTEKVV